MENLGQNRISVITLLVEKLYKYSIKKNYKAGTMILNENSQEHFLRLPCF